VTVKKKYTKQQHEQFVNSLYLAAKARLAQLTVLSLTGSPDDDALASIDPRLLELLRAADSAPIAPLQELIKYLSSHVEN
jgi:hypothetical protein